MANGHLGESSCVNDGDTAWVLVSTILVLGMMPALGLFEAGLLRSKNSLSIVTQIVGGLVTLSFMWNLIGYSLVFAPSAGGMIGRLHNVVLIGVYANDCSEHAPHIPELAFATFMLMFAAITPLLMTGAYAERVHWRAFFLITVLWEALVFYPVAHWMWGHGWLRDLGALDFAGGIVIHTTAGAGSVVLAIMVGRRKDYDKYHGEFPPSNLPMASLGAALLWMGWFGFNAGSALTAGAVATSAVATTQSAASASGLVWMVASWVRDKPSCVALINGVIAGLAGITPASGYVDPQAAFIIGLVLGVFSYFSVYIMKHKLRIDDALDVSSVHGLTGVIGSLAIGVCGQRNDDQTQMDSLMYGSGRLMWVQIVAVVVCGVYAAVLTALIGLFVQKTVGLRSSEEDELHGLDISEHREYAYHQLALEGHEFWVMEKHASAAIFGAQDVVVVPADQVNNLRASQSLLAGAAGTAAVTVPMNATASGRLVALSPVGSLTNRTAQAARAINDDGAAVPVVSRGNSTRDLGAVQPPLNERTALLEARRYGHIPDKYGDD